MSMKPNFTNKEMSHIRSLCDSLIVAHVKEGQANQSKLHTLIDITLKHYDPNKPDSNIDFVPALNQLKEYIAGIYGEESRDIKYLSCVAHMMQLSDNRREQRVGEILEKETKTYDYRIKRRRRRKMYGKYR